MKTAIITGANGFLGFALTKKLLALGFRVYGISTTGDKFSSLEGDFHPVIADFASYEEVTEQITTEQVDVLFHCGWMGATPQEYQNYQLQVENLRVIPALVRMAKEKKCKKIINIASCYAQKCVTIEGEVSQDSLYGIVKESFDKLLKLQCIQEKIGYNGVFFCVLFGIGDHSNRIVNLFIKTAMEKKTPVLVEGNYLFDFVYIDDAVEGVLSIYEKGKPYKPYYLGSRTLKTFKEYITALFQAVEPSISLEFGGYPDTSLIDYSKFDTEALYEDTGFVCQCDFKESIIKTKNWLEEQMK